MDVISTRIEKSRIISPLIIIFFWLLIRLYFYGKYWADITGLLPQKSLGLWYFGGAYLADHLGLSMLYLRAAAPLPQLLIGLIEQLSGWPFTIPWTSFFLSVLILISAFLIRGLLILSGYRVWLASLVSVIFVLSPDAILCEIDGFPSAFYTVLSASLFLLSLFYFFKMFHDESIERRNFIIFCACVNFLIISMSSLSYFFLVPFFLAFFIDSRYRLPMMVLPIFLQLAWSIKNYLIYGYFGWGMTSIPGLYILSGLANSGSMSAFFDFMATKINIDTINCYIPSYSPECYPEYYLVDKHFTQMTLQDYSVFPANSNIAHKVSGIIFPLYLEYIVQKPEIILDVFCKSYVNFWGNVRSGIAVISGMRKDDFFNLLVIFYNGVRYLNIAVTHVFCMPFFVFCLFKLFSGKSNSKDMVFIYAFMCFLYILIVTKLIAYGENNRYRFSVEAILWVMPFLAFSFCKSSRCDWVNIKRD